MWVPKLIQEPKGVLGLSENICLYCRWAFTYTFWPYSWWIKKILNRNRMINREKKSYTKRNFVLLGKILLRGPEDQDTKKYPNKKWYFQWSSDFTKMYSFFIFVFGYFYLCVHDEAKLCYLPFFFLSVCINILLSSTWTRYCRAVKKILLEFNALGTS